MSFITKDSGERQNFESGARRDISTGKPRYDLLSLKALRRWAELMGRGAEKYGSRNWEKGMPTSRMAESALRHFFQYMECDRSEDHLAAALFNIGGMIHFEGTQWDDINGTPAEEITVDDETYEWILDVCEDDCDCKDGWEQLELPFDAPVDEKPKSMINWEQLRLDVEAGKVDASQVAWPAGEAPKVSLAKKAKS